ncbi:MAG: hypothetical protein KTR24_13220 [Saprospiraceae bacterium]|nr:hypothetical protein [Saprospiraceae bacterium]
MKRIILNLIFLCSASMVFGQTLEELKAQKAEKEAVAAGINEEIAAIDKEIRSFPGWTKGASISLGANLNGTNNWFANDDPTTSATGWQAGFLGFANNNAEKAFWRNSLVMNMGRSKSKITNLDGSEEELSAKSSYFEASSLGGYYFIKNVAISSEARFETTIFEFFNPGILTFSAGFTWTPITELAVVVHPLAYQIVLPSGDFSSAAGAKIGATYTGQITDGVKWNSNLNAFLAYSGDDEATPALAASDLSNWTWFNNFIIDNVWKGIGINLTLGLRNNKQFALAKGSSEDGLQTLWGLGLAYTVGF